MINFTTLVEGVLVSEQQTSSTPAEQPQNPQQSSTSVDQKIQTNLNKKLFEYNNFAKRDVNSSQSEIIRTIAKMYTLDNKQKDTNSGRLATAAAVVQGLAKSF